MYFVLTTYSQGVPHKVTLATRNNQQLMNKIRKDAVKAGCSQFIQTHGEEICQGKWLLSASMWDDREAAHAFFYQNESVQQFLRECGIASIELKIISTERSKAGMVKPKALKKELQKA